MSPITLREIDRLANLAHHSWVNPALLSSNSNGPTIGGLFIHRSKEMSAFMSENKADHSSWIIVQARI